tara:strand:- start:105 stop:842 length:738 start_codon:yes stop_codon:yes gene_type:complete
MKTGYIFRLDDIAPNMNWEMMLKVKKLFNKYNVKPILGVIPKNEDQELKKYPLCKSNFWEEIKNYRNEGWEIAMHGYEHLYDMKCKKIDYLEHGGRSEFVGHSYETQLKKIRLGLDIFKKQDLDIKIFFAPNHTFDQNTINACKNLGFKSLIDGYGLTPYSENGIIFIPQLFYKLYSLPVGIQTIQLHLNIFSNSDYIKLENFIIKKQKKIISYKEAIKLERNNKIDKIIRFLLRKLLKLKRIII